MSIDGVADLLDLSRVPLDDYNSAQKFLAPYSYDPTNGTASAGDIFYVQTEKHT